jgi:hypothetical protein
MFLLRQISSRATQDIPTFRKTEYLPESSWFYLMVTLERNPYFLNKEKVIIVAKVWVNPEKHIFMIEIRNNFHNTILTGLVKLQIHWDKCSM